MVDDTPATMHARERCCHHKRWRLQSEAATLGTERGVTLSKLGKLAARIGTQEIRQLGAAAIKNGDDGANQQLGRVRSNNAERAVRRAAQWRGTASCAAQS